MDDKIVLVAFVTLFSIIAAIGNCVMIHIMVSEKKLRKPMHLVLFHLQFTDLLVFVNQIFRFVQLILDENETDFCMINVSTATIITILTIGSFMLVSIACDRYFMFHRHEYQERNEGFKRKIKLSVAAAWFLGLSLSGLQISAGFVTKMTRKCPQSLDLHESTMFVIIAIILAIFMASSFVAAVILFALVGKKIRMGNIASLITDITEIKPTITAIVVTGIRLLLTAIAAVGFFVLSLSQEFQNVQLGIVDLFQIVMVFSGILTTGIFTLRTKSVKKAMKSFFVM